MTESYDMSLDEIIKQNKKKGGANKAHVTKAQKSKIRPKIQQQKPKTYQQHHQPRAVKDAGQTMLHVSNLHFKVSNKDLKELFEDIAPIKKAAVHYDKNGKSLGTAEVIFFTREAAIRAIKKYSQRLLDGRPMSIALVPTSNDSVISRIGVKAGSGIQKRPHKQQTTKRTSAISSPRKQATNNKGRPNKGKPGTRQPKKEVTAEQLDADLEAYTAMVE